MKPHLLQVFPFPHCLGILQSCTLLLGSVAVFNTNNVVGSSLYLYILLYLLFCHTFLVLLPASFPLHLYSITVSLHLLYSFSCTCIPCAFTSILSNLPELHEAVPVSFPNVTSTHICIPKVVPAFPKAVPVISLGWTSIS